jgi:polyhydroxybutyrate depolymerase
MLHIPSAYKGDAPVPLIIDYHAIGGSGQNQLDISLYPEVTDQEGVIMAFPDGLPGPAGTAWNIEVCCINDIKHADDVIFSKEMIADIEKVVCIDSSRIYAVGRSTGGGMAYYLACHAADVFAAVAPAGFDLIQETVDSCVPHRPVTVVSFRGTANLLRPYDGGLSTVVSGYPINLLGAVNTFDKWAALNQCSGTISDVENGCRAYLPPQCEGGVEVWLCTIEGGETQPGDPAIAWPILRAHALP